LKDGDANSKYFHSVLSSRRRRNAIVSLMVDGSLVEGVQRIRQAVFSHFRYHFAASDMYRPGVDKLVMLQIFSSKCDGCVGKFHDRMLDFM